jgi:hypothetical protein
MVIARYDISFSFKENGSVMFFTACEISFNSYVMMLELLCPSLQSTFYTWCPHGSCLRDFVRKRVFFSFNVQFTCLRRFYTRISNLTVFIRYCFNYVFTNTINDHYLGCVSREQQIK